jgi:tetratricopeptide (TPR) repeat protein
VVARALVNQGVKLGELGRSEEAIEVYGQVVARYGDRPEAPLAEQVARALGALSLILGEAGLWKESLSAAERSLAILEQRTPELDRLLRSALQVKAVALHGLGRTEAAEEVLEQVRKLQG